MVKTSACFNGVVEKVGFGLIALLHSLNSAFGFDPFENQADDVNGECGRRVIERIFLDVRAVLKKGGEIFVGALGKILANDDDGDARRAQVFLSAGKDEAELFYIDGARSNV